MKRILYATDFSPASRAAFDKALAMAKADPSELVIVHAIAPVMPPANGYITATAYSEIDAAARRYCGKQVDALVRRARNAGVRSRGVLVEGIAHDAIVRAASKQHADMIVVGTHGRTGLAKFMLGSVAGRVVAHARCPVLTVRGRG